MAASVLAGTLVVTLTIPAKAALIDPAAPTSGWTKADAVSGAVARTRADAYSWITSAINRTGTRALQSLSASSTPNSTEVLSAYTSYLLYMDWVCSNVSYQDTNNQWTVFAGPADFDTTSVSELVAMGEQIRGKIIETQILSDDQMDSSSATKNALPGVEIFQEEGGLAGTTDYWDAAVALVTDYIDTRVTAILGKYLEVNAVNASALASVVEEEIPYEWFEQTVAGNPPAEFIKIANECSKELRQYLAVYNELLHVYDTTASAVLANETFTATDGEHAVVGYRYAAARARIDSHAKYYTRALHHYLYSSKNTDEENSTGIELPGTLPINSSFSLMVKGNLLPSGVVYTQDDEKELTELGYHVLAAGVTYVPFQSTAGDEVFVATLESFLKNSDKMRDVVDILQNAVNIKKPLYVTETRSALWISRDSLNALDVAEYRYATLADMLQIDKNIVRGYALIKGKMNASQVDSSTWDYVAGSGKVDIGAPKEGTATESPTPASGSMEQKVTAGAESITASSQQMTDLIAITAGNNTAVFGTDTFGEVQTIGGLTSLILHNASTNVKNSSILANPESQLLFVNGLGDIVLQDGTMVLPAIANPALYDYTDVNAMLIASGIDQNLAKERPGYYPYTATFMNGYPNISIGLEAIAYATPGDQGKYAIMKDGNNQYAAKIYNVKGNSQAQVKFTDRVGVIAINTYTLSVTDDETLKQSLLPYAVADTGNWRYLFSTSSGAASAIGFDKMFLAKSTGVDGNQTYFPLVASDKDILDSYLGVARPLVTSAIRYISNPADSGQSGIVGSGTFHVQSYIENFLAEGSLGTPYSSTIAKNLQLDYKAMVDDQYNRFTVFLMYAVRAVTNSIGSIDGVLAIKDGYENGFFNFVMNFFQETYLLLAVALLLVLAVKFIRGQVNAIYVVFIGFLSLTAFNVYAVWMPTALPAAYNFFVNDAVEDLVWNTVAVKSEDYDNVYIESGMKDSVTGNPRPYTATITLYKLTNGELAAVADKTGAPLEEIKSGDVVWLDEEAGIFLQGDQIKQSIDRLFVNNSMRGLYQNQWAMIDSGLGEPAPVDNSLVDNPYVIKLTNPYVSLESYYTPFAQFERAFLVNLNNFSNIFSIERNFFSYGDGLYKDAFLFNTFTNSGIFTAPGDDEILLANIWADTLNGDIATTPQDIVDLCNQKFYPQSDWMNLRSVFYDPSPAMRDSLWGAMMQRAGYYEDDWTTTPEQDEKIWDLISYINNQTKRWVVTHQDQLNYCSDENAIKLTSLFATTAFTHRVSQFGYWLYPNYINASSIQLNDVLLASMTSLFDRNASADGNLSESVLLNIGVPGLLMLLVISLASAVFILIVTYAVPILYILFGAMLVWKLLNTDDSSGVVKGYFKVTALTILLYFGYTFGLRLVGVSGYTWYGYFGALLCTVFLLYLLLHVLTAVVINPMELGNGVFGQRLFSAFNKLSGGRLGNLVANNFRVSMPSLHSSAGFVRAGYGRSSPLDAVSTSRRPKRGEHYGRWEDFDDTSLPTRARVISRFGKIASHADEVGRTRTGFRTTRVGAAVRKASGTVNDIRGGVRDASDRVRQVRNNVHTQAETVRSGVRKLGDRFVNFGRRR